MNIPLFSDLGAFTVWAAICATFTVVIVLFYIIEKQIKKRLLSSDETNKIISHAIAQQFEELEALKRLRKEMETDIKALAEIKSAQKTFQFIQEGRGRGLADDEIIEELRSAGWSGEDVKSALLEEEKLSALLKKVSAK